MARRKTPSFPDALLDDLLQGSDPGSALGPGGLLEHLKKALAERVLNAEMAHHLQAEPASENSRNGYGRKTVTTESGKVDLEIPRDRSGSFEPQLIGKYQRRLPGFDEKVISMDRARHERAGDHRAS